MLSQIVTTAPGVVALTHTGEKTCQYEDLLKTANLQRAFQLSSYVQKGSLT